MQTFNIHFTGSVRLTCRLLTESTMYTHRKNLLIKASSGMVSLNSASLDVLALLTR